MAYGDYDGPNKLDKGRRGGSCNRTLCQAPDANWWNRGSRSWYCADCAHELSYDRFNEQDARRMGIHPLCIFVATEEPSPRGA